MKTLIKKSKCCNSHIYWSKGSYLGTGEWACDNCGKPCYTEDVEIETIPASQSGGYGVIDTQT